MNESDLWERFDSRRVGNAQTEFKPREERCCYRCSLQSSILSDSAVLWLLCSANGRVYLFSHIDSILNGLQRFSQWELIPVVASETCRHIIMRYGRKKGNSLRGISAERKLKIDNRLTCLKNLVWALRKKNFLLKYFDVTQ